MIKTLKTLPNKGSGKKNQRERKVLIGLIEYYIQSGKPVGSNTLKEVEFGELSSATIRNYFANLEKEGYLSQQHISGGRIPTDLAYQFYANECLDSVESEPLILPEQKGLDAIRHEETRELAAFLQTSAEYLSRLTQTAVFLSAPRFEQDYVMDLKLVGIDHQRSLCVIITEFGMIRTEILYHDQKLSAFTLKRLEAYFKWRLKGCVQVENLSPEEEKLGQKFYNELMIRYIVGCSYGMEEEIYRTGFSKLLSYPELHDPQTMAHSLNIFEDAHSIRLLLKECTKLERLKVWIGEELLNYSQAPKDVAVIAIPYCVNQRSVGAVGLLGPSRIPYRRLFALMKAFTNSVSEALTRNIYKFKINFKPPGYKDEIETSSDILGHSQLILLEDKSLELNI